MKTAKRNFVSSQFTCKGFFVTQLKFSVNIRILHILILKNKERIGRAKSSQNLTQCVSLFYVLSYSLLDEGECRLWKSPFFSVKFTYVTFKRKH